MGLVDLNRKEIKNARENLFKAFEDHSDSDDICFKIAETYEYNYSGVQYGDGFDIDTCIYFYKEAIRINKKNAKAYFKIGKIFYLSEKYNKAISAFKRAVRIKFNYGEAYYFLAKIYELQKRYDLSIYCYKFAGCLGKGKYWYEECIVKTGQLQ